LQLSLSRTRSPRPPSIVRIYDLWHQGKIAEALEL
jgi:hypothetical protein